MFSSQYGVTPLHDASKRGHTDVVKLLVDSGAQIDNTDRVSTEASMVLRCDSSSIISYFCPPLHHAFVVIASLLESNYMYSVK